MVLIILHLAQKNSEYGHFLRSVVVGKTSNKNTIARYHGFQLIFTLKNRLNTLNTVKIKHQTHFSDIGLKSQFIEYVYLLFDRE